MRPWHRRFHIESFQRSTTEQPKWLNLHLRKGAFTRVIMHEENLGFLLLSPHWFYRREGLLDVRPVLWAGFISMPAGFSTTSDSIDQYKGISTMEAWVAIASARLFLSLGTWTKTTSSKSETRRSASSWYGIHLESLVFHSPTTWLITNFESPTTFRWVTLNVRVLFRLCVVPFINIW